MNLSYDSMMSKAIFDWDYALWDVRLKLLAAGFFTYLGVFLLAHWLSSWISASYRTLSAKEKVFWNVDIACTLFSVQCCAAGLWALLIDPVFQADQVYSQQKWSWFHCLIASGFFLYENLVLHVSHIIFRTCDVLIILHHLFAFGGLLGLITNITSGHYLPLMGLLLEMSNPSHCISSILLKTGWGNTFFWKANKMVQIHLLHCRMILTYHMWWVCISHWKEVVGNLGLPYFIVFFLGLSLVTFILNPCITYIVTQHFFTVDDELSK